MSSTPSSTVCACSRTETSARRSWRRSRTPTCWSGGRGTSGAGEGSTAPRRSLPCRRGSPTTPPRRWRAPSSGNRAPPSTCAAPSWMAASSSSPPPRARRDAMWRRSWAPPSSTSSTPSSASRRACHWRSAGGRWSSVDEMQSMPGVDYESMLSELGKYGASFVLATPVPRQARRPLPLHAEHPPRQRGLPRRLPGGGCRRPGARPGAGARPRLRGGHRLPPRPPLLRARHGGHGAHAGLLREGA